MYQLDYYTVHCICIRVPSYKSLIQGQCGHTVICKGLYHNIVKPVLKDTCIKIPPALRDHSFGFPLICCTFDIFSTSIKRPPALRDQHWGVPWVVS